MHVAKYMYRLHTFSLHVFALADEQDKYNERGKKIFQDNARLLDSLGAAKVDVSETYTCTCTYKTTKDILHFFLFARKLLRTELGLWQACSKKSKYC